MNPRIVPVELVGSPQAVFARLRALPGCALLESSKAMAGLSGWSFVCGPALAGLHSDANGTQLRAVDGRVWGEWADPFDAMRAVMAAAPACEASGPAEPPFVGGLVGYLGYDLARHVERLPSLAAEDPALPWMHLGLCDHVLAHEHETGRWFSASSVWSAWPAGDRQAVWDHTLRLAAGADAAPGRFDAGPMASRTGEARYQADVQQVLDLIAAGDLFQANLSHRLEGDFQGDPFALYQALTAANPAPFSAYLEAAGPDGWAIASVSPERFLKLRDGVVTARPIKGTLARGADVDADEQARQRLADSVKDRAENLMIVDLMRNDLGRVAATGSVAVDGLFELEAHPSVWQMVSTIRARLREGVGVPELLRACWPPGSMTGAPKVRAMEVIDTLEPVRRGPYAGAIGYLDLRGAMDLSVVIRTAVVHQGRVMVQVGGAVVADSVPEAELAETYAKGRLLLSTLAGRGPSQV